MFHGRLQILPCLSAKPKAITQWLNDQAEDGLMFKMALGDKLALFRKSEKKDTKYVLRTSTTKASNVVYVGVLGTYLVYKTSNLSVDPELRITKRLWIRAVIWALWAFALFSSPQYSEFPIEHRLSWQSVGIAFITLYFLIDIIIHLLCIFALSHSSKYSRRGKVINGAMICVLAIGIALLLANALYTPTGYYTQPVLREDSKRAYIEEKYVPFGQRTEYTEHLAHGGSLRIADYQFVSSSFAEHFFDVYCEDVDAREITQTDTAICNELEQLFNYTEKDDSFKIVSNRACNFFLIKYESRVMRFGTSSDVSACDIFRWTGE